jgi:hypothetical protein
MCVQVGTEDIWLCRKEHEIFASTAHDPRAAAAARPQRSTDRRRGTIQRVFSRLMLTMGADWHSQHRRGSGIMSGCEPRDLGRCTDAGG